MTLAVYPLLLKPGASMGEAEGKTSTTPAIGRRFKGQFPLVMAAVIFYPVIVPLFCNIRYHGTAQS